MLTAYHFENTQLQTELKRSAHLYYTVLKTWCFTSALGLMTHFLAFWMTPHWHTSQKQFKNILVEPRRGHDPIWVRFFSRFLQKRHAIVTESSQIVRAGWTGEANQSGQSSYGAWNLEYQVQRGKFKLSKKLSKTGVGSRSMWVQTKESFKKACSVSTGFDSCLRAVCVCGVYMFSLHASV